MRQDIELDGNKMLFIEHLVQNQFHIDTNLLSYSELFSYYKGAQQIRLWLNGKSPFAIKAKDIAAMTPDEYVEALLNGDIKADNGPLPDMDKDKANSFLASLSGIGF